MRASMFRKGFSAVAFLLAPSGTKRFQLPPSWVWNYNDPPQVPYKFLAWVGENFLTGGRFGGWTHWTDRQTPQTQGGLIERRTYEWRNYVQDNGIVRGVALNGAQQSSPYSPPFEAKAVKVWSPISFDPAPDVWPVPLPATLPRYEPISPPQYESPLRESGQPSAPGLPARQPGPFIPVPSWVGVPPSIGGWEWTFDPTIRVPATAPGVGQPGSEPASPPVRARVPSRPRPPRRREKERKLKTKTRLAMWHFLNAVTEGADLVEALWEAIPDALRPWRASHDIYGKMRDLWKHWDQIDLEDAITNIVVQNIEDMIWAIEGRANAAAGRRFGELTGRQTGTGTDYGFLAQTQNALAEKYDTEFSSAPGILIEWLNLEPGVRAGLREDTDALRAWIMSHVAGVEPARKGDKHVAAPQRRVRGI